MTLTNSLKRVQILSELVNRLTAVVREVLVVAAELRDATEDPELRARLDRVIRNADGQIASAHDAMLRGVEDLPEGEDDLTDEQSPPEWP